ncbi:MAG: sialidase family protein [Gemmatimonadota bacterium]|nr:sialidase family protein [Gemmatimonadota bacterium]
MLYTSVFITLFKGTSDAAHNEKPFYRAQLIFKPTLRFPRCHASTIAALPDGSLMAAWWNGPEEAGKDLVIRASRRAPGQNMWERPWVLVDNPGEPEGVPVLFVAPGGELWLIYRTGLQFDEMMWMKSADMGHTWGESYVLSREPGWCGRSRVIQLANGDIFIPILGLRGRKHQNSAFLYSTNRGKSWKRTEEIKTEPRNNEPAVIQRTDGSLLTFMRPHDPEPEKRFLWRSESVDNGRTWSKPVRTGIRNPSSAVELLKLDNGHVVLVFNDTQASRSFLYLAVSLDDGRSWSFKRVLEDSPGRFSYPALSLAADGHIHVSYTFRRTHVKHVEVNEAWIMEKP